MDIAKPDLSSPTTWKSYLFKALKFLVTFYITTFCMLVFFIHRGEDWLIQGICLVILYLFVLTVSLKKFFSKLPMPAILLASPTIPLFMLMIVISMIPALQFIDKQFTLTAKMDQHTD